MPITEMDRKALVALIESYGGKALRAVGLAHRDISAKEASKSRKELLSAEDIEHDLVLDAIVVSGSRMGCVEASHCSLFEHLIFVCCA